MRIQFIKSRLVGRDILDPGAVRDVPDDLARLFIQRGIAARYNEPQDAVEAVSLIEPIKVEKATRRAVRKAVSHE